MADVNNTLDFLPTSEYSVGKKSFKRFIIRSMRSFVLESIYRRELRDLNSFFSTSPFSKVRDISADLQTKALGRYFFRCTDTRGRFRAILDHYTLFSKYFDDDVFLAAHTQEILIAQTLYKDQKLALYLCRQDGFSREAEIRVKLTFNNVTIVQMGMSFVDRKRLGLGASGDALWIGIVKSSIPGEPGRESFRHFTKAFEGLRPKYLHVMFVQSLARALGISEIFAPSYCGQAVASSRRFKQRVHADYDGFWEECGGERINQYLYQIPCERPPRDLSEYKPNKRSQAKKRQELETGLRQAMCQMFESLKRPEAVL
ncbi:DUF535 family protein [Allorhizobium terrae]|uniref:DUF535 domain-containing protein n=1 Tax=Allorhizobium terrae TaxID=1848972 RepID=A0A4S3ZNF5_9HYPH|nr:DUF535 family protein [Allorhizobium terrae]THF46965.1 DUF535 domain-containing protein [Allorhizobium terrae]